MTDTAPASLTRHRYTVPILIGITALSVAACGSSPTASTSSPQPAASGSTSATAPATKGTTGTPPKGGGKDHVAGLITAVTGNTFTVSDNNVTSTVGFSSSTKVSEVTPAALTDVTVGSCVSVRPARGTGPAPDGSLTAAAVSVSAPKDGQCFPTRRPPVGASTATPPGGPGGHGGLRGTVASVSGNTVVVTTAGTSTPANVSLSGTTTYSKRAPADSQAIAQGKCVTARGNTDGTGTLQADMIGLRPSDNGSCPSMHH